MKTTRHIVLWSFVAVAFFLLADNILNAVFMKGINHYYGLDQKADLLVVGHSHLMLAVDKERLEKESGLKVSKYCREGVNVADKQAMVKHFLELPCADSLKYVLYGVDLATFTGEGLSEYSYKLFLPFIGDEAMREHIRSQAPATDYWLHRLVKTARFNDDGIKNSAIRGWLNNWDNMKTNVIDIEQYKLRLKNGDERHIQMNPTLMAKFDETVKSITNRGVKVILVNTPTLDLLNNFEPAKYQKMMKWFENYAAKDSLVEFWDFSPKYSADHTIFSDRLHLNSKGQQLITTELVAKLKQIQYENPN